jgi:gamma-glutamyltranspeptidase/glutathione hydrolase
MTALAHHRPAPRLLRLSALLLATLLAGCTSTPPERAPLSADQPEIATSELNRPAAPAALFERQAVAAAHPLAAEAGLAMLRAGGTAIDAAVAVQAVLGLVEPQSSGLGGGAFLLYWDGQRTSAWDGRETAPAGIDARQFLDAAGQPLGFDAAVATGGAVGVPGALRMLEATQRRHGRLPWAQLFEPAIRLAENGFALSPRLVRQLETDPYLRHDPAARALYYGADGHALPVGSRLRNPDYAAVLRAIAANGADALHSGPIAAAIVRSVQSEPAPGTMTAADLAGYQPLQREALCLPWRIWRLCGMPPPSSGMLTIGQILGLLEQRQAPAPADLERSAPGDAVPSADFLHRYTEAARLAFADRDRYIADPAFVAAPGGDWTTLWDASYLAERARLIGARSIGHAPAGRPAGTTLSWSDDRSPELPATSHVSIVDAEGHALAMTTTIEAQFGARRMVNSGSGRPGGFLLNNQLTDFSFVPEADGRPVANRIEPGKRPRSSMAPTLVFELGQAGAPDRLIATLGSPGGPTIIHFVAKTLLGTLAWQLTPQAAIDLPNFGAANQPVTLIERDRLPAATLQALRERGHDVRQVDLPSGLHLLQLQSDGRWHGGADPRREGVVLGD